MNYEQILYEVRDEILTLTLHRPEKLNAFTDRMQQELCDAFGRANKDDGVKAVIVTGAGRAFCAGADLSSGGAAFDLKKQAGRLEGGGAVDWNDKRLRDSGGRLSLAIFGCLKPVIAAVNGPAVGIGATMLLPMDIRIASDEARFGFVFVRRGIVPEACSSWFLPRIVGISKALSWCYSGRVFDAREAMAGGLVGEVLDPAELKSRARAIAREIIDNAAPVSIALTRQMMWRMLGADHPMQAHRVDSRAMFARGTSPDAQEGVTSFLEKRPAHFAQTVSASMPDFFPWWDEPGFSD